MSSWLNFLDEVQTVTKGVSYPFYRGCGASAHSLLPSLFRVRRRQYVECNVYYDFVSYSAPLLGNRRMEPIETLFEMRHAHIPTRLLDWTETFAVALYFALSYQAPSPCIWILEPELLNTKAIGHELIVQSDVVGYDPDHGTVRYQDKALKLPLAIFPAMQSARIFAQKGHFTIHGSCEQPLEELCPECVTRIDLPPDAVPEARRFLQLAGLNEYSIFPDVDGLARFLIDKHGLDRRLKVAAAKAKRKT